MAEFHNWFPIFPSDGMTAPLPDLAISAIAKNFDRRCFTTPHNFIARQP